MDDFKQASVIVLSLGYLPLAVDQTGAFIRRREKSLKDYRRLFEEKQHEVLCITPGISGYEKNRRNCLGTQLPPPGKGLVYGFGAFNPILLPRAR